MDNSPIVYDNHIHGGMSYNPTTDTFSVLTHTYLFEIKFDTDTATIFDYFATVANGGLAISTANINDGR